MDLNNAIPFIIGVLILFVFGRLLVFPIKKILGLIGNSILGVILIYIVNFIGGFFNFHLGLNFITILFVAILGIPGAVVLTLIKLLIGWKSIILLKNRLYKIKKS